MINLCMSCDGIVGRIVISKNGHDKGGVYVVTGTQGDKFALLVNGENRQVTNPKRKNIVHLFVTKTRSAATDDLGIKRAISVFKKEGE